MSIGGRPYGGLPAATERVPLGVPTPPAPGAGAAGWRASDPGAARRSPPTPLAVARLLAEKLGSGEEGR